MKKEDVRFYWLLMQVLAGGRPPGDLVKDEMFRTGVSASAATSRVIPATTGRTCSRRSA